MENKCARLACRNLRARADPSMRHANHAHYSCRLFGWPSHAMCTHASSPLHGVRCALLRNDQERCSGFVSACRRNVSATAVFVARGLTVSAAMLNATASQSIDCVEATPAAKAFVQDRASFRLSFNIWKVCESSTFTRGARARRIYVKAKVGSASLGPIKDSRRCKHTNSSVFLTRI
jgi:hypothetical protein